MTQLIRSHNDLIDALGGTSALAEWADVGPSAVSNWRADGIPRGMHLLLALEARRRGLVIDYVAVFGVDPELITGPDPLARPTEAAAA